MDLMVEKWIRRISPINERFKLNFDNSIINNSILNLLGKSWLVFPKLTNVTIHINSTFSGNIRQVTDTK